MSEKGNPAPCLTASDPHAIFPLQKKKNKAPNSTPVSITADPEKKDGISFKSSPIEPTPGSDSRTSARPGRTG